MKYGLRFTTLYRRQGSRPTPWEKKMQKSKMALWRGLTNICRKKRSKKQRRKGKIFPFECRVPKNSKERQESLSQQQCKEIEENNRIGKTRDLKKIRDTKGTFHAKMSLIKDRHSMDLTLQVPRQYCSLQNQTLLSPPDTSTTGHHPSFRSYFPTLPW